MIGSVRRRPVDAHEASVGELVERASAQLSELVRREMRLAQAELVQKGKRAGIGGGMFGGAALTGFLALQALVAGAVAALALVLPVWASALIIGGALLLVTGVLALVGKKELRSATPPTPQQALGSVRADIAEIRGRMHR
ncbi:MULTISPECIES: phage holin family protein [unclassified Streptomyces]|uniref:phage holin family protein n=1 Tax=unclassified Streptomyces TaxID=2593676 RepID=UPI0022B69508|nr:MULTISPECIES: phage holin family protein [unclassified Streptomyces]MCZ7412978.1 phage holin family protein [Streptomyces sp. WMMC897]MCZ7434713.1 phage holin family protein [Streptomyces sp. WMMC1477]